MHGALISDVPSAPFLVNYRRGGVKISAALIVRSLRHRISVVFCGDDDRDTVWETT